MNAALIATDIYHALHVDTRAELEVDPAGRHSIKLDNGWKLTFVDDPNDECPNGVTWWLDSPGEPLVDSGGWEDPEEEASFHGDFGKLADRLEALAKHC